MSNRYNRNKWQKTPEDERKIHFTNNNAKPYKYRHKRLLKVERIQIMDVTMIPIGRLKNCRINFF